MGPVNWLAVVLAAAVALAIGAAWNGPLSRSGRTSLGSAPRGVGRFWPAGLVLLLAAVMLGHNFASKIGRAHV